MKLEQIVKETVAKIVDEKKLTSAEKKKKEDIVMAMKKTFKGPEPVMHAIATKNAIELAEDDIDEAVGNFELKKLAREFYSVIKPVKGVQQLQVKTSNDILKTKSGFSQRAFTAGTTNQNQVAREGIATVYIEVHEKENALQVVIAGKENTAMVAQRIDQALTAFVMKNYKDQLQAEYGKSDDGSLYYITVRLKQATNETEKLAEEGDHEVSMAQRSLNSILRSAMELKAKIGNQEINIPAWIQDHITNSENFIDQASQGYHEYHNGGEHEEMNEETNDTPYKQGEAANKAHKHYTLNPYPKGSKEHDDFYNGWMNAETASQMAHDEFMFRKERGMDEVFQSKESNDDKIERYEKYTYTLDGEVVKPEITFLNNILKAMLGNKIYNIGAPENGNVELSPESGKKGTYTESQELDEYVIRRWQHYAGIK
jgi:hypothetical protein